MENEKMPTSFKIYWAIHNIALVTAFVITIVYWTVLHSEFFLSFYLLLINSLNLF